MGKPAGRAAIYTRISKDRSGESLGVQRQEQECRTLAETLGMVVGAVHSDNDISAFSGKRRPGYEALLDAVRAGEVDTVIAWHTDRLYRSMKDLERLIEIADAARAQIVTVNSGELNLSTSAGRMVARVLGSVARQESEHHSERRKLKYIQQAASGAYDNHGHRTFGYTRDGQPYEPEAAMLRAAAADVLEGGSLRGIARLWNEVGMTTTLGTRWNATRIKRLLLNPRYAAIRMHLGKKLPGNWTPLIDEDTHRRLVADLTDPARVKVTSFERKYIGSGIYLCGVCGAAMRVSFPGKGKRSYGRKYACSAHSCVMRAGEPVDDYVENLVVERLSRPDANLLIDGPGCDVEALQNKRAGWVAKYDQLVELLDDGSLDGPRAREKAAEYRAEIAAIDSELAAAARTSPTAALLATGTELRKRWAALPPAVRSQVIDEIATVTINPTRRGVRVFNPDAIAVQWKGGTRTGPGRPVVVAPLSAKEPVQVAE